MLRISITLPPCVVLFALAGCASVSAEKPEPVVDETAVRTEEPKPQTIATRTAELERRDGFVTLFIDAEKGTILAELPAPSEDNGACLEFLLANGLRRGLGSNPVGLDRGQLRGAALVRVRRIGPRVLFERPNLAFRADSGNAQERRAVDESFATSVIWGADAVLVEESGRCLVDLGPFLLLDHRGVAETLANADQGKYSLDPVRSVVELSDALAFPDNVELESTLTFTTGGSPGRYVRETAPDARSISLVQHVSLIRLPEAGYRTRPFDPRTGSISIGYLDPSRPLDATLDVRLSTRHRLQHRVPGDPGSAVVEPIVYYVDPGAPEPVRQALIDGASWWADAFADAGFPGGFRVELLPEDAHPLDVRYNVIQWVHRSTRGWSYGMSITDPRTGEILKGHVSLGSLRVRQDRLLFEGLLGVEKTGSGALDDPIVLALSRIRQLAAHEVGHTLGLVHNFAASTQNRASVMDYPPPRVTARADGTLDVKQAYAVGVGAWDRHAIRWLYSEFAESADESAALIAIANDGIEAGLVFLTDSDARAPGSAEPRANLWDDGTDAIAGLENAIDVRAAALSRFGIHNIPSGTPIARLQEVFAPLYFHHRYQVDAALKKIGGFEYDHAIRDDAHPKPRPIPAEDQRRALALLLSTTATVFLDIDDRTLSALRPRPLGSPANRESFTGTSDPAFDRLSAAASAANQVYDGLLNGARCSRLVDQASRDEGQLSLDEILELMRERVLPRREPAGISPREVELERAVQRVIVDAMLRRANAGNTLPAVRAAIDGNLDTLAAGLQARTEGLRKNATPDSRFLRTILLDIERHLTRAPGERGGRTPAAPPPPGSPIGCGEECTGG